MKRILACLDFSDVSDSTREAAAELAQKVGGELLLVHVMAPRAYVTSSDMALLSPDPEPELLRGQAEQDFREACRQLEAQEQLVAGRGLKVSSVCVEGAAVAEIIDQAAAFDADLIVMGSHGHGALYRLLLGSVTSGVLRRAGQPVLVVPSPQATKSPPSD